MEDLPRGGWPDDTQATEIAVKDNGDVLIASATIGFLECVPSSCHDHPHKHDRTADFTVRIRKADGAHNIEEEYSYDDEDEVYAADYF